MCTAIFSTAGPHPYFGRNLDYERSFGESVAITPRNVPLSFCALPTLTRHYAMIGMAHVANGTALYYDAINEHGLSMAGLLFAGNAFYQKPDPNAANVASFELIGYLLGRCTTVDEAEVLLRQVNVTDEAFSPDLPPSPLHWMLADRTRCVVIEALKDGLHVHENPVGVLANNPPFPYQMTYLQHFASLSPKSPENRAFPSHNAVPYSRGMGAMGLPGDFSSASRFVKAAFLREHSRSGPTEREGVHQFFHLLQAVAQVRGAVELEGGELEFTLYSSCCNMDEGIYYYTTYENNAITAVRLRDADLGGSQVVSIPLVTSDL